MWSFVTEKVLRRKTEKLGEWGRFWAFWRCVWVWRGGRGRDMRGMTGL